MSEVEKLIQAGAIKFVKSDLEKTYTINDLYSLANKFNTHFIDSKYPLTAAVIDDLIKEIK